MTKCEAQVEVAMVMSGHSQFHDELWSALGEFENEIPLCLDYGNLLLALVLAGFTATPFEPEVDSDDAFADAFVLSAPRDEWETNRAGMLQRVIQKCRELTDEARE